MPEPATLALFAGAAAVLLAIPGPAVLYIVTRGIHQGRRAALLSVLGIHAGTLVHVIAAAVGISAILASSAAAFTIVKLAGAAYLVYLAIRTLRGTDEDATEGQPVVAAPRRILAEGFVVNVLNPKTALFFLAFLPQFIDPSRGAAALQAVVLGGVFVGLGLISDGAYAFASGALGGWIARRRSVARLGRRVSAAIYAALGVGTALAGTTQRG